jgi:release factor glutamine methyltransferase
VTASPTSDRLIADTAQRLAAAGVETPKLEAELLLAHVLQVSRTAVMAGIHPPPTEAHLRSLEDLVVRRCTREPLAYLRGTQEFYGLSFKVSPAVLIPRPETELLVEAVLTRFRAQHSHTPPVIADAGTGSGCIAVACAVHLPHAEIHAIDISQDALAVARANALQHRVADRITFHHGDLLAPLHGKAIEMIVSNPPYIASEELTQLMPEVSRFEPKIALTPGSDPLSIYRRLAQQASRTLVTDGTLAVEVGAGQAQDVAEILLRAGFASIERRRDPAGIERVVQAVWKQS